MHLNIGDRAPDFSLPCETGELISLSSFEKYKVVLYFYPKDLTPGCTVEAEEFKASNESFSAVNTQIIGVSRDSITKHKTFITKYDLPFPLISDSEAILCQAYGVWVEKKNYGRTYMGIERATFFIDENRTILNIWRKVKVKGHVSQVLENVIAS